MLQIMCLSFGQFAKTISSPPSSTVVVISVLLKSKLVIFDNVHSQVKVDSSTFTTITRFMFYSQKFFTVEFTGYFLA